MNTLNNFIDGVYTPVSASRNRIPVLNPADGTILALVPLSSIAEVDQAVQSAKKAFKPWR